MINDPVTTVKNSWGINKLGAGMFTIGTILCVFCVILSITLRLNFASISDNAIYVVTMFGIGVPFILAGIGILLRRPKKSPTFMVSEGIIENYVGGTGESYIREPNENHIGGTSENHVGWTNETYIVGTHENYIEKNEMIIIELVVSFLLAVFLFASYPDGWVYPKFYILIVPYAICLSLLTIDILSNINEKETEISRIKNEVERSDMIIKEKEEMCKDNSAPDYTTDFAEKLNGNIDDLKAIMDELKISIDIGTRGIAERAAMVANKYRSDNEKLHNDLRGFKQRTEKEKIEFKERSNERVIKSLMSMLHNIDELSKYRDKNASYTVGDIGKIKENVYNIIEDEGVDIINPSIGDNFDDKKCCAIKTIETDKFPGNKIVDIKKIGCMFKSGKVISYADVIVSKNDVKVEENTKVDAKVDTKVDTKAQVETTKVDTKVDAKVDIKTTIGGIEIDTKTGTKPGTKTVTKTVIQGLIEYVKTKIYGKTDSGEQSRKDENKKDENKKDENKKDENKKDENKKDENNKVRTTSEFKKKGD